MFKMADWRYSAGAMTKIIRIGSRSSKLSLWQAHFVADLIRAHYDDVRVELKLFQTRGDKILTQPLAAIGSKGLFTQELEAALRRREIDCAVHSLKDLPTEEAEGLCLGAIPKRGQPHDALVSREGKNLAQLPHGAAVGTGSHRRRAQLLHHRPDLRIMDIRGNVPTRIQKLMADNSPYDAIVLAAAGLERLKLSDYITEIFAIARMTSAAGQGALAIQCRAEPDAIAFFAPLTDEKTRLAVTAERAFLAALGAGCSLPVAAYAFVENNQLHLHGRVTATDGSRQVNVTSKAALIPKSRNMQTAHQLGVHAAQQALQQGAAAILLAIQP